MIAIGIDLSINCTGVCIIDDSKKDSKPRYIIIPSKLTKRMKSFRHNRVEIRDYKKIEHDLDNNIQQIGSVIKNILSEYHPDLVIIEDIALNGSGRVADLSILNGYTRAICDMFEIKHMEVRPTSWKKEMLGNGMADKEQTIASWKLLDPIDYQGIKIDDAADSYYLAQYGLNTINKNRNE